MSDFKKYKATHKRFLTATTIACLVAVLSIKLYPTCIALATIDNNIDKNTETRPATINRAANIQTLSHITTITKETYQNQKQTQNTIRKQNQRKPALKTVFKDIPETDYYSTCVLNARSKPETDKDNIVTVLYPYQKITVTAKSKDWCQIKFKNRYAYVSRKHIVPESDLNYKVISIPINDNKFKSWMPYTAITDKSSKQYQIQQNAYDGTYGIRILNGRYCVAVGNYFDMPVGTYFDLVLANNTIIPCVLAEVKSDMHTCANRIQTEHDGSMVEFIVNSKTLNKNAKLTGNISNCCDDWNAKIKTVIKY